MPSEARRKKRVVGPNLFVDCTALLRTSYVDIYIDGKRKYMAWGRKVKELTLSPGNHQVEASGGPLYRRPPVTVSIDGYSSYRLTPHIKGFSFSFEVEEIGASE